MASLITDVSVVVWRLYPLRGSVFLTTANRHPDARSRYDFVAPATLSCKSLIHIDLEQEEEQGLRLWS